MSDYLKIAKEVMRDRQTGLRSAAAKPLEAVLKGQALELWSDALSERFWLVADDELLGEPRGNIAAEPRRVVQIGDPATVHEIHEWQQTFKRRGREQGGTK